MYKTLHVLFYKIFVDVEAETVAIVLTQPIRSCGLAANGRFCAESVPSARQTAVYVSVYITSNLSALL